MSSGAVVIQVAYDGTDLCTSDLRFTAKILTGLTGGLEVGGSDRVIPRAAGVREHTRVPRVRHIEVEINVQGTGADEAAQRSDFRDALIELEALFDPARTPANLVATLEDGRTATIRARPGTTIPHEWDRAIASAGTINVELTSTTDPYWTIAGGS